MKKLYFLFLLLCSTANGFAFSINDDDAHALSFKIPPLRIISLAPDITEILFSIHAEELLVGVISGSDFPGAAKTIPLVGSYAGIDVERIISLHPDLIITWDTNFARQLATLKKLNIPVYHNNPKTLLDIPHAMENFGRMLGKEKMAQAAAKKIREQLQTIMNNTAPTLTVFYQIGDSMLTVNKESWITEAITLCGGRNLFADTLSKVAEIDLETIVRHNPDVIISSAQNDNWQWRWRKWPSLYAVKQHFLFTIPSDELERAGPRLVAGVEKICRDFEFVRLAKQAP